MITGLFAALFVSAMAFGAEVSRHNKTRAKWATEAKARLALSKEHAEALAQRDAALEALDNALPTLKAPVWTL